MFPRKSRFIYLFGIKALLLSLVKTNQMGILWMQMILINIGEIFFYYIWFLFFFLFTPNGNQNWAVHIMQVLFLFFFLNVYHRKHVVCLCLSKCTMWICLSLVQTIANCVLVQIPLCSYGVGPSEVFLLMGMFRIGINFLSPEAAYINVLLEHVCIT